MKCTVKCLAKCGRRKGIFCTDKGSWSGLRIYICQRKNLKEKFTTWNSEWAYYSQGPLSKLVIAPNITLPQTLPPLSSFVSELYIMRSYLQCSHDTCSILQLLLGSGTKGSTDMKKAGGVKNILVENVTLVSGVGPRWPGAEWEWRRYLYSRTNPPLSQTPARPNLKSGGPACRPATN